MTFVEFVEKLKRAGWVARNDAQHEHIRELWDELCFKGMTVPYSQRDQKTATEVHGRK